MKKILLIIFTIIVSLFLFINIYIYNSFNNNIPILAYHDVLKNPVYDTDVSIENFENQMEYLYKHNYKTLSLDEFYDWKKGKNIKGKKVLITFDDGYESFYTKVVPILEKYDFKAIVFVVENNVDVDKYLSNKQINDLKNNHKNMDVQAHSYDLHIMDKAKSNNYDIYNNDMKKNSNKKYNYYAYPYGMASNNYIKALKDNNYKMAFLFAPGKWANRNQDDYKITRVPVYKPNSLFRFKLKVTLNLRK